MGTRHLVMVSLNNQIKVAQYGQWDGYPTGQGEIIAKFLQEKLDLTKFKKRVSELNWITENELKDRWVECGADRDSDFVSMAVSDIFRNKYPFLSRDSGAGILELIQNDAYIYEKTEFDAVNGLSITEHKVKIKVDLIKNDMEFASDSLFCEWAYLLDLDNEVVEVYRGFNKEPLSESDRFFFLPKKKSCSGNEYYPVKLACIIPFSEFTPDSMEQLENHINDNEEE